MNKTNILIKLDATEAELRACAGVLASLRGELGRAWGIKAYSSKNLSPIFDSTDFPQGSDGNTLDRYTYLPQLAQMIYSLITTLSADQSKDLAIRLAGEALAIFRQQIDLAQQDGA